LSRGIKTTSAPATSPVCEGQQLEGVDPSLQPLAHPGVASPLKCSVKPKRSGHHSSRSTAQCNHRPLYRRLARLREGSAPHRLLPSLRPEDLVKAIQVRWRLGCGIECNDSGEIKAVFTELSHLSERLRVSLCQRCLACGRTNDGNSSHRRV